jgi:hypothetical protein
MHEMSNRDAEDLAQVQEFQCGDLAFAALDPNEGGSIDSQPICKLGLAQLTSEPSLTDAVAQLGRRLNGRHSVNIAHTTKPCTAD